MCNMGGTPPPWATQSPNGEEGPVKERTHGEGRMGEACAWQSLRELPPSGGDMDMGEA